MYKMSKRARTTVSVAEARRRFAEVLETARGGTPVEVTKNGEPIAAIVPISSLRAMERPSLATVIARFRATVSPEDLEGPDPFADVRDRSPGREVDLE